MFRTLECFQVGGQIEIDLKVGGQANGHWSARIWWTRFRPSIFANCWNVSWRIHVFNYFSNIQNLFKDSCDNVTNNNVTKNLCQKYVTDITSSFIDLLGRENPFSGSKFGYFSSQKYFWVNKNRKPIRIEYFLLTNRSYAPLLKMQKSGSWSWQWRFQAIIFNFCSKCHLETSFSLTPSR